MTTMQQADAELIAAAYQNRELSHSESVFEAVDRTIEALDRGELRVAELRDGVWIVNDWVKQAILLYFVSHQSSESHAGPLGFFDKVPMKTQWEGTGVRVVPPGAARYGSYLAPGVI